MKRAFTIVELLVAIGLFGILLAASGIIFATAIDAHRTAEATTEIARNLAAITDQLNADFRGLRKDCPIAIWFEAVPADPCDPCSPIVRHDQILFFADGDFQSYRYNPPLIGNTARVYYGQANTIDYPDRTVAVGDEYFKSNILARRQHIYFPPVPGDPCSFPDITNFVSSFIPQNNDRYEHDNISLSPWKTITNDPCYNKQIIQTCFSNTSPEGRPGIDLDKAETLHMLMAQGVGHFKIQWSYFLRWWPSTDPDGDGDNSDSDFPPEEMFGIYFNMPGGINNDWGTFPGFFPEALKFTFTLYDSKKIFKQGKTFTHIVYLGD